MLDAWGSERATTRVAPMNFLLTYGGPGLYECLREMLWYDTLPSTFDERISEKQQVGEGVCQ